MKNKLRWSLAVLALCLAGLSCSVIDLKVVTPTSAQPSAPPAKPAPRVITATRKPTHTPAPTLTPETTATLAPTSTLAPTGTAVPSPEAPLAPAGFKKFSGEGMEIWLPEAFIGGNLSTDLDLIIANLKNLGPQFEQMAAQIEQNRSMFKLWAFDNRTAQTNFLVNVSVANQPVLSGVTVESVMSATAEMLPASFTVVEQKLLTTGAYEMGRLIIDAEIQGVRAREALYFIKDGSTLWLVTCASGRDDFAQHLVEFEQAVATFKALP
jgi:hypothetical protein